jgi:ectoine hydroxylase-related dioxygenase (phytanoyl-CoA dioxygenase family)
MLDYISEIDANEDIGMVALLAVNEFVNQSDPHALSPYHLTPEQVQFFDDNGYLILRNWIPQELVRRLRGAGDVWIEEGWKRYESGYVNKKWDDDWAFANREHGKVMYRVNYLHDKNQSASLELLGSPQVLAVAESLCGRNFVPTYESMVFKQEGDGEEVKWHQDAIHPRQYRIFNFDVYLDPSLANNGALRVIPKSQQGKIDHCLLADEHGWTPPGVVVVEMQPGDVLLHDVMVVHGSPHVEGNALRRTLYYEFRAAEEILEEGPWDREWIDRRLRLVPVGLRRHAQAFPDADQFQWNIAPDFRPEVTDDDEVELKVAHVVHTPSAYCSAGSVTKDSAS